MQWINKVLSHLLRYHHWEFIIWTFSLWLFANKANVASLVPLGSCLVPWVPQSTLGDFAGQLVLGISCGTKEADIIDMGAVLAKKLPYALWPRPLNITADGFPVYGSGYEDQVKVDLHITSYLIQ